MKSSNSAICYLLLVIVMILIPLFPYIYQQKKIKDLQRRGIRISAIVTRVETRMVCTGKIGGPVFQDTFFAIHAIWTKPETGECYIFKSEWLSYKPRECIEERPVSVWIDFKNPRRYYMELLS